MPKKYWNFPAFNPDKLHKLTVRQVTVLRWTDRGHTDICINVTASLRHETHPRGYFLSKRLNVGFERTPNQRFFLKRMNVVESTAVISISHDEHLQPRFLAREPLLLASTTVSESRLVIAEYAFDEMVMGPPASDPDIPF